jgi:glutamine cyclotransferase
LNSPKKINIDKQLDLTVQEKNGNPIDSVRYYLDGKKINNSSTIKDIKLGKHAISAVVFYGEKQKKLTNTVSFLADKTPEIYTYQIVNEFPHDTNAFTEGLEYYNGYLYESTGQNGKSSLRKVELETGKVLQKYDLDKEYFGEGMTIYNNKIYMLTWKKMRGLIFNLETFELEGDFAYNQSKEGWGLTHNTNNLIKSDGTERIWFLNPDTQLEERFIEAYTHKDKVTNINELEFIDSMIYANRWQKEGIAIINPKSGAVEGIINLKGLKTKMDQKDTVGVLNGIAYDAENDRMFVTGKNWSKIFEIKLKKK